MATLSAESSSPSLKTRRKSFARRCERYCCNTIIYLPLVFVYGLTSWAVWVQASVGFASKQYGWTGYWSSCLGIALYLLLNWCYTVAVFTDPGSPLTQTTNAYSVVRSDEEEPELDTHAPLMTGGPVHASVTVKSTGESRYCKKCHTQKPDRAHHCSTCRRCVLKMDHHCPWLATCVGFRNYKAFLLFLIYVSLFCIVCFWISAAWVLEEIFGELQISDQIMPVNYVLLAVLAGILGLVISGFTGWHFYLACTGQTTIESLESTRYLSPQRKAAQHQMHRHSQGQQTFLGQDVGSEPADQSLTDQLRNIHANVLPGITRPEEGLDTPPQIATPLGSTMSPAHASLRRNLSSNPFDPANEFQRERDRYSAYLDEVESAKLPHAFDLGWRRNLRHLFGESLLLAWLPICNTTGDGWNWEPSPKWLDATARLARERAARQREEQAFEQERRDTMGGFERGIENNNVPNGNIATSARPFGSGPPTSYHPSAQRRNPGPGQLAHNTATTGSTQNWNDIPEDFLDPRGSGIPRPRSRGVIDNLKDGANGV